MQPNDTLVEMIKSVWFGIKVIIIHVNYGSPLDCFKMTHTVAELPKQPNLREILKTSLVILVIAETACIITAETVDLIFYKQAFYLSIPLALLAGPFTVVVPEAYKKMKEAKMS